MSAETVTYNSVGSLLGCKYAPLQNVQGYQLFNNGGSSQLLCVQPLNVVTGTNNGLTAILSGPIVTQSGQNVKFCNITTSGILMTANTGVFQINTVASTGSYVVGAQVSPNFVLNVVSGVYTWYPV